MPSRPWPWFVLKFNAVLAVPPVTSTKDTFPLFLLCIITPPALETYTSAPFKSLPNTLATSSAVACAILLKSAV